MKPISIILVDDHTLVRQTWAFVLSTDARFRVVGECASGEEAIAVIPQLQPDVVIMDINLPGISGIEATGQLTLAGCPAKIIGASLHTDLTYANRIMEKGARGYVTKNSSREEMAKAINVVYEGGHYVCHEMQLLQAQAAQNPVNRNRE